MAPHIRYNRELWKRVYQSYMIDQHPLDDIAEQLGYLDNQTITQLRETYGLPARTKQYLFNSAARQMFTDEQEQILLGGVLGDGCIMERDSRNPIYTETHSVHQLEYISWKQAKLFPFVTKVSIGHKETQAQIRSVGLPQLGFYRKVFYPAGHKTIPVESLPWFDDLALAVWYMDDGSISNKGQTVRLATCGFNLQTVGMLQGWLATKFSVFSVVGLTNGKYPTLQLRWGSNDNFLKIVEPYIIPSMRYKLGQW